MLDKVDVLIIGAGASGAAIAWSVAETKMRILCLGQGDWMKQSDYPSNGRDYEARLFSDYAISPNIRQRGIVTLTFVRQPEVHDDFAAHIKLRFGRTCPAARH
jgi:choline dehydrogenase-like flavoprotein